VSRRNVLFRIQYYRGALGQMLADRPWHLPVCLCPRIRHLDNRFAVWIERLVLLPIIEG
jgi:hypothetical protein